MDSIYCPKYKKLMNCVRNTSECFQPFERQIISWVLTSTRRLNMRRCKNDNEKHKFLKLTNSCLMQMQNTMDDCMQTYISSLDSIAELSKYIERSSDNDDQIQLSCCANMRFKDCMMRQAQKRCKPHDSVRRLRGANSISSQRAAKRQVEQSKSNMMTDLKTTLDSMALTGPEFICHKVDESFCRTKYESTFAKVKRDAAAALAAISGGNKRRRSLEPKIKHKSIVPALLRIYSND